METRHELETFGDEDGVRFVVGTHNPQYALAALQREDQSPDGSMNPGHHVDESDVVGFDYGWFLRLEPPHPDLTRQYMPADDSTLNAEPVTIWRP